MQMTKSIDPGIYTDLPGRAYHSLPGTSSTELKQWWQSPAHGVQYREEGTEWRPSFDVGNMIHDALLDPHDLEHTYVWYDQTKTRRTKTYQKECRDKGKIGIMPDDVEMIQRIRDEVEACPAIPDDLLEGGHAEISFFWNDPETETLLKCRPDYIREGDTAVTVVDVKSVRSGKSTPSEFRRRIANLDYELSAALYTDGVEALVEKPVRYLFLVVDKEPPYLPSLIRLTDDAIDYGRQQYRQALETMHRWDSGDLDYHGFATEPAVVDLPPWKQSLIDNRTTQE